MKLHINELRVGNKLLKDGVVVTIDARTIFDIWDDNGLEKYEPIPLNEEWRIRFGFIVEYGSMYLPVDNFRLYHYVTKDGEIFICLERGEEEFDLTNRCQYVHQIQNIIFDLTGEELKYKV